MKSIRYCPDIARQLYPDADIRAQGFETAAVVDGSFDLAISNVPFGDYKVFDPQFNERNFLVHDYFFAKGHGDRCGQAGLMVFITSKGTLDKVNSSLRDYLYDKADFLGAIRLPNTAFKQNANTEVTTDIVFLRRLAEGEKPSGPAWLKLAEHINADGVAFQINEYFAAQPAHDARARWRTPGTMYRAGRAGARSGWARPRRRAARGGGATAAGHLPRAASRRTHGSRRATRRSSRRTT